MADSKKILITNFGALTIVQALNYALPLVILPYLVRVIGPARFGILAFAQAVVFYFTLIPDLGTNLYAPREIALVKDDSKALSSFVSGILIIKVLFLCASLVLYLGVVLVVPRFKQEALVFMFSSGYMIANTLLPVWFFQGIEKMVNITMGFFVARVLSLVLIFSFVREKGDYVMVPLINSGGLMAGAFLMYVLIYKEGIRIIMPARHMIRRILSESVPLFVSNVAISVYTGINTVVLGFLTTDTVVGYYSAAEKLVRAGMGLQGQLGNVFYPHTSSMLRISRQKGIESMRVGLVATMLLAVPACIFVVTFASQIVEFMLGQRFGGSVVPLRIMGLLFLVIGLSNVFGIQVLLPLGKRKEIMKPTIGGGILNMAIIFFLAPWLKQVGAAMALLLSETLVTVWMFLEVKAIHLDLASHKVIMRLGLLAVILFLFSMVSRLMCIGDIMAIIFFLALYMALIFLLKLVDLDTRSIVTQ